MRRFVVGISCLIVPWVAALAGYDNRPEAQALLQTLARDYAFTPPQLTDVRTALAQAQSVPALIQKEQQAKEKTLTWSAYRPLHVNAANIERGLAFLDAQRRWLDKAEQVYGVPPVVIAAVLGVETKYGTQPGRHRVLDALATQGFDHPTRAAFFFQELVQFFVFCRDSGYSAPDVRGSYAGAMGAAQFMPSSTLRFAVDFDGDGKTDLWALPDAIGSVANYLVNYRPEQGWRRGEPVAALARVADGAALDGLAVNPKNPADTVGGLAQRGVATAGLALGMPAGLLRMDLDGGAEYWLGLHNFYAVMSYNPRVYYAMAVAQLAEALQQTAATAEASAAR